MSHHRMAFSANPVNVRYLVAAASSHPDLTPRLCVCRGPVRSLYRPKEETLRDSDYRWPVHALTISAADPRSSGRRFSDEL